MSLPIVTPADQRRETCPDARFGRPHFWMTGAFYWPIHAVTGRQLYVGEDYVACGGCGEIRSEEDA